MSYSYRIKMNNLLIAIFLVLSVTKLEAYKVRVFGYTPTIEDTAEETLLKNTDLFLERIGGSTNIWVLPEYGLTGSNVFEKDYKNFAVNIPDVNSAEDKNLCGSVTVHKLIRDFACGAKQLNTYIVVNVLERDSQDADIIYNTNIVFKKNGALVAKYRKINLYGAEADKLTPGKDIVTFKTDFDVTFGLMTSYDILFSNPASDIFEQHFDVKDVIVTAAWFSELPFLAATTVQDGYARRYGINLLVSAYNDAKHGAGGYGIYTPNSNTVEIQTVDSTSVLYADVKELTKRDPQAVCSNSVVNSASSRGLLGSTASPETFATTSDFEKHSGSYNTHKLSTSDLKSDKKLCSNDDKICCHFYSELQTQLRDNDPRYKFAAYSRNGRFGCAVVACKTDDKKTCGNNFESAKSVVFKNITIITKSIKSYELSMPSTVGYNLAPLEDYSYCINDEKASITTNKQQSGVITFGMLHSAAPLGQAFSAILMVVSVLITYNFI